MAEVESSPTLSLGMIPVLAVVSRSLLRAVDLLSWLDSPDLVALCECVLREVTAALVSWPFACADGFAWWLPA